MSRSRGNTFTEIVHALSLGLIEAETGEAWSVDPSPFEAQDDVKAVFADVAIRPDPLPELGEGAIWDERSQRLLFLDILGARLFRFDPKQPDSLEAHALGEFSSAVSSVVPLSDSCDSTGNVVGITVTEGFATYNFRTRQFISLPNNPQVASGERFNDGKVDTLGRYWAGTIARDSDGSPTPKGALYRRNLDGSVDKVLKDISISNGLTWGKDSEQDVMYFTDTATGQVDVLKYHDRTGAVTDRRKCIEGFDFETTGLPDGHCMDSEGMLWIACFNGGMVRRFNPKTGDILAEVHVPDEGGRQVTSCAFGGDDLSDLYITTAHEFMPVEKLRENGIPLAGALFKVPREKLEAVGAVCGKRVNRWFLPGAGRSSTCLCAGGCEVQ